MPQTLLALFAICTAATFSLQQQRAILHSQLGMIANEVSTQSMGVAAEVLERIEAVSFDEATAEASGVVPSTSMTDAESLGPEEGEDGYGEYDDVDDFHGTSYTILRQVTNPSTGSIQDLEFVVTAHVRYLKEDPDTGELVESETPTYRKRVELLVRCPGIGGGKTPEMRVGRTYAYFA